MDTWTAEESPLTRDDVIGILGEVDDLLISSILATGATRAELVEAVAETEREANEGEPASAASSARVARLRDLLDRPLTEERWDDEDRTGE